MKKKRLCAAAAVLVLLVAGYLAWNFQKDDGPPFHDFLVTTHDDYTRLVDDSHPLVEAKAEEFKSLADAYHFVRDQVAYAPFLPAAMPGETLEKMAASCLGKATLLCSLYLGMGVDSSKVRVVTGIVAHPQGLTEHAWVDLEHNGICLQQDPSNLLGGFAFDDFMGTQYTDTFVVKELFCFNDVDFGIISQVNRIRKKGMF